MSVLSGILLAQIITVGASDRSEMAAQFTSSDTTYRFMTAPQLSLSVASQRSRLSLSYSPQLSFFSLGTPRQQRLLMHQFGLVFERGWRRLSLSAFESITYGSQTFWGGGGAGSSTEVAAPTTTPSGGTPAVPPSVVGGTRPELLNRTTETMSTTTSARLSYRLSERVTTALLGSFYWGGGIDFDSQVILPRMRGPTVEANAAVQGSPRDRLSFAASASWLYVQRAYRSEEVSLFPNSEFREPLVDSEIGLVRGTAAWEHRHNAHLSTAYMGGLATKLGSGTLLPIARIGADLRFGSQSSDYRWSSSVDLSPNISPILAFVDQRATWNSRFSWARRPVVWFATTSVGKSVGSDAPVSSTIVGASSGLQVRLARHWQGEVGIRYNKFLINDVWQPAFTTPYIAIAYDDQFGPY